MASPGPPISAYEAARLARIADNKKRMAEMGLDKLTADAAATAAAAAAAPPRRVAAPPRRRHRPAGPPPPARRSGRVAGLPPAPEHAAGLAGGAGAAADRAAVAAAPTFAREAYGPAALAALGTVTDGAAWALFVDGYDPATKKRVYDKAGKTCHQCRQKVRATFSQCGVCGALRGNFCGDCLYMRYGEHVAQARARNEAAAAAAAAAAASAGGGGGGSGGSGGGGGGGEPSTSAPTPAPTAPTPTPWACPPCRGLCNCSFHRSGAGLPPTGSLYRGALAAGFPSVAHFLVLSRLTPAGRAALAAAAAGAGAPGAPPGPAPPAAWLAAGPGEDGTGSDDEDEAALATAAGLWARAVAGGALGQGAVPAAPGE